MKIFYSDLDNTLIYSYKREMPPDKQCVELYQGREVSFMTSQSLRLLASLRRQMEFIPVTTRTIEQYQRIVIGQQPPGYALVCNGGILLRNGVRDEEWYEESLRLIQDCRQELLKAVQYLETDANRSFEVRLIEELFVFTKSEAPKVTAGRLRELLDETRMDVFENGTKVYAVPKHLSKGHAVRRLNQKLHPEYTIAAGDSRFDISMLLAADMGIAPDGLKECGGEKNIIKIDSAQGVFSDFFLSYIMN